MSQPLPLFLDGEEVVTADRMPAVDPTTGCPVGEICVASHDEVDRAVAAAREALADWAGTPLNQRIALLERTATAVEASAAELAEAEIMDTGRPAVMAATFDVPRAAATFREFARIAANLPGESLLSDTPDGAGAVSYTLREPVGVVGLVCPWNLPLVLLVWKLAPALAAGNTVVVKPSEHSPSSALVLARIMKSVGLPDGVVNVVHGLGAGAPGEWLVGHPDVAAISFTGQTETGRRIMGYAAQGLKKLSFELGGKNAAVLFEDADLATAIPETARSVFMHAGQLCLCNERVFVHRSIYERVLEGLVGAARSMRPGPPREETTRMGPMISAAQRDKVLSASSRAREDGGTLIAGGGVPDLSAPHDGGFFVEPTVVADLDHGSPVWRDEIFGPVCAVAPFDDEEEVTGRVNETGYGLTASVWTRDGARAARVGHRLRVGVVWLNCWLVRDPRTPFGGVGMSGTGREGGVHSFEFFTELRQVTSKL